MEEETGEWQVPDPPFLPRDLGHSGERLFLGSVGQGERFAEEAEGVCAEDGVGEEGELMVDLEVDQGLLQVVGAERSECGGRL